MVSKVYPMRSHTVSAEGGAAAVMSKDDSYDTHAFDTVKGSDYLADQDVVDAFVREAPLEVVQMEHWGCPWSRNADGSVAVRPFGGMTTWRTVFAADKSGFHMLHTVFQTSLKYDSIQRHDEAFVTSLLVEDSRCVGVTAIDIQTGKIGAITAKATILATGGLGRIYAFTTNGNICTGDVIDRKLPFMRELGREFVGIDIVKDPIPVRPVQHYMMGGVDADISGATPMKGLYAAGECANVGLNGGNRLGSNSLSECLVFGAAAGRAAAEQVGSLAAVGANPIDALLKDETKRVEAGFLDKKGGDERIAEIREDMQHSMDEGAGVYRTKEGLTELTRRLDGFRERFERIKIDDSSRVFNTELTAAIELDFMLECAVAVAHSALAREESRGAHARRDFPERNDEKYLKHTIAHHTDAGPRLEYRDVTLGKFEPKARTY